MSLGIDYASLDEGTVQLGRNQHVFEEDDVLAINAALASERPLLVRGEPGTGKSQLARAAAVALGRELVHYTVNANTDTRDLLFQIDAVARLAQAQVMGALGNVSEVRVKEALALPCFTSPGPVWWALDPSSAKVQHERTESHHCGVVSPERAANDGVVVLIDEIDKADEAVPNGLLDALGDRRFSAPGHDGWIELNHPGGAPLVVITTNEERALPDAFLRRCWVLHLAVPAQEAGMVDFVLRRARAHFPDADDELLQAAATLLVRDRLAAMGQPYAPPGIAELVDLLRAVTAQRSDTQGALKLLGRIARFALRKHAGEVDPAAGLGEVAS